MDERVMPVLMADKVMGRGRGLGQVIVISA